MANYEELKKNEESFKDAICGVRYAFPISINRDGEGI